MAVYFKGGYEEIEPFCKWLRGQERDVLEIHLKGFTKENLKVQLNNNGILTISGENGALENTKKYRFRKLIKIGNEYKRDDIHARFTDEILYIKFPRVPINDRISVQAPAPTPPPTKSPQVANEANNNTNDRTRDESTQRHSNDRSGNETIRRRPDFLGDGMIGKNIALGVAMVVGAGIIIGGFIIWKCTSNPPILIY